MSCLGEKVEIDTDAYLRLVSSKIVLDVIKNSIERFKSENADVESSETDDNGDSASKKAKTWTVNVSSKCSDRSPPKRDLTSVNYVALRKHFNTKRWYCISRPQYKYSCGISSLVSCWNYLYSVLGYGKLKPLNQEEAMNILGFKEPYDDIRFGPFTGNVTLMKWFEKINKHFAVNGHASFFYKPVGANRTIGVSSKLARERLKNLLKSKDTAFIYHCYNHYCCPVGFESEPVDRTQIYESNNGEVYVNDENGFVDWIFIADTSRKYGNFHCVKWKDIDRDLNTQYPEFINIRHLERGLQSKTTKSSCSITPDQDNQDEQSSATSTIPSANQRRTSKNKNLHCIIQFKRTAFCSASTFSTDITDPDNSRDFDHNSTLSSESKQELASSSVFGDEDEE